MTELGQNVGRQPLAHLATNSGALNVAAAVLNTLRKIQFDPNFTVRYVPGGGLFVGLNRLNVAQNTGTFSCVLAGNTVQVRHGTFRIAGVGNYYCPDTAINLSGSPDWVFAWMSRDGSAQGIDHQTTEPVSDTNTLRVPLAWYTINGDGSYSLGDTTHLYDVVIDVPLR